uniref:Asparagine-rich antigen n=1 Tax=Strongyloides venezuelensis TaxID=75913 RepID=A0A0K0FPM3_STRVS
MNSKKNKSSCDKLNLNFYTGSNENSDIYKNVPIEEESENFNNVIEDNTSFDDLKSGGNDKIFNNSIVGEITENHGYTNVVLDEKIIEKTENVDMENLKNQTLVSDEDIFAFLDKNDDKIVYFVNGNATNDPSSKHINVLGVDILEVFNSRKQINYYSKTSFL